MVLNGEVLGTLIAAPFAIDISAEKLASRTRWKCLCRI